MQKLLFFIPTLTGGGAEKVLVTLVNNLDYDEFDITVMTLLNKGAYIGQLNERIKYKSIINVSNNLLARILSYAIQFLISPKLIHRCFVGNRYDVEIAYMEGYPVKLISASKKSRSKKYAWVHCDTDTNREQEIVLGGIKKAKQYYKKMDAIFFVSQFARDAFANRFGIRDNLYVQYNVLDEQHIKRGSMESQFEIKREDKEYILISVGRLTEQKAFPRLIFVVKQLLDEQYNIKLFILGEGEQRDELENLIKGLNLKNNVFLLGFRDNPYKYVKAADIFVCSSISEGFSTAATEAIILEKPVVTTNCFGMSELLGDNNEFGIITENSQNGLYEGLKTMLDGNLEKYTKAAKARSESFTKEKRIEEYRRILNAGCGVYNKSGK